MPSVRTGWWYSTRPSSYSPMPSSSTLRQGSHPSLPSSAMSTSVLRGPPPYRWWERIPNITPSEYSRIICNDDDYDNLMAILFQQSDLYSRTITMRHLWITAQKLRREADRQQIKVRQLSMEMEGLALQQALHPHQNTPPRESFSPDTWLPTPYYPAPGQETRYQESVEWSLTPPPMSLPLWAWGNPIIIEDSNDKLDGWDDDFYTAESTFFYANLFSFTLSRMWRLTTSIFWMFSVHMQLLLSMSTNALSIWLSRTLKLVTSTIVLWTLLFFSTCIHHAFTYPFLFPFNMCLLEGKHAFHLCLHYFYIMFYMCLPWGLHISFEYLNQ